MMLIVIFWFHGSPEIGCKFGGWVRGNFCGAAFFAPRVALPPRLIRLSFASQAPKPRLVRPLTLIVT